jgi:hypothetical protein
VWVLEGPIVFVLIIRIALASWRATVVRLCSSGETQLLISQSVVIAFGARCVLRPLASRVPFQEASVETRFLGGSTMKFQNMIRSGLVIAGLGAVLSFPGSVWAQEITNSTFSDGPNVAAFAQPNATAQSTDLNSNALPGPEAAKASAAIASAVQPQPAIDEHEPTEGSMWAGVAFLWISAAAVLAYIPAKRFVDRMRALRNSTVSTHSA